MNLVNLEGKVAIVTGGASGIGRATARALAAEGASVVIADLDGEGAARVAGEIGVAAIARQTDVADEASVVAMVEAAVDRFGGLDVLHNNAAASDPAIVGADVEVVDLDLGIWERTLAVNLRGPMLGCKHAIPRMIERGGGAIINTSSASGQTGDLARPAYGVSKAGVDSLSRYVATIYGKRGIRCNSVSPGVISTPALAANITAEEIAIYERSTLTPRLGTPEDVAALVVFLASEGGAFITGQVLHVDGGLLAHHPAFGELTKPSA